jgi:Raf kinase inhibitor-like YbhB/YbcL family protein
MVRALALAFTLTSAGACRPKGAGAAPEATNQLPEDPPMSAFHVSSPAFPEMGPMPARFTCEGGDVSPPLVWTDAPPATKSFALIIDDPDAPDPDAPKRVWVHWVVLNLPASTSGLTEGIAKTGLPDGARVGKNDWGNTAYGGPCPPIGRHRYFHKLYALDTILGLDAPTKAELVEAMNGHILAQAQVIGTYKKGG